MVQTGADADNIFRQIYQIQLADIHRQAHRYFGLLGIVNLVNTLSNTLIVQALLNLAISAQEVKCFYDKVRSYMIAKEIEVSITKKFLKIIRLHGGEFEWPYAGGITRNDISTML